MPITTAINPFIENLPKLFDSIGDNKFEQKFIDTHHAREFAESLRKLHSDVVDVEQRIGRVIITVK